MGVGDGRNIPSDMKPLFRVLYPEQIERQRRYAHEGSVAVIRFISSSGLFRGYAIF